MIRPEEDLLANLDEMSDEDLHPSQRYAEYWRLVCAADLEVQWGIKEIVFFDDDTCSSSSLRSGITEVLNSRSGAWDPENALDANQQTLWKTYCGQGSACQGDAGCEKCKAGQAYLGVKFVRPVIVRCVYLIQLEPGNGACPELVLQFSSTGKPDSWSMRDVFEEIGATAYLVPEVPPEFSSGAVIPYGPDLASLGLIVCTFVALETTALRDVHWR